MCKAGQQFIYGSKYSVALNVPIIMKLKIAQCIKFHQTRSISIESTGINNKYMLS
jgi:hypothetical protein